MEGEKQAINHGRHSTEPYKLHSRYGDDFDTKLDVNKYFVDHPDMVLGKTVCQWYDESAPPL